MARTRKKVSLYEVIGRGRSKLSSDKRLESLQGTSGPQRPSDHRQRERGTSWPRGPRIVQLVGGRVEISVPYQLAIAVLLGLILLILVVFRFGQSHGAGPVPSAAKKSRAVEGPADRATEIEAFAPAKVGPVQTLVIERAVEVTEAAVVSADSAQGRNRIVIQTYPVRTHLEPAKEYFAEHGIAALIERIGGRYYLVTAARYDNPEREGTDGYAAKQRIIELGAGYRAPQGYETFGKRPFHDAYGMRFDD